VSILVRLIAFTRQQESPPFCLGTAECVQHSSASIAAGTCESESVGQWRRSCRLPRWEAQIPASRRQRRSHMRAASDSARQRRTSTQESTAHTRSRSGERMSQQGTEIASQTRSPTDTCTQLGTVPSTRGFAVQWLHRTFLVGKNAPLRQCRSSPKDKPPDRRGGGTARC
jgi:hypothetical protein